MSQDEPLFASPPGTTAAAFAMPNPSSPADANPDGEPAACLLLRATRGDAAAASQLLPKVYGELRNVAAAYLDRERVDHTLQPTALVHEAYLRLANGSRQWNDSVHFLAAAAVAMRCVLVDHARAKRAEKRDGGARVDLPTGGSADARRECDLLELNDLLDRLRQLDARKARVVELRFFAGMTNDQIAEVLDVARSTVAEDWAVARAWLAAQLGTPG